MIVERIDIGQEVGKRWIEWNKVKQMKMEMEIVPFVGKDPISNEFVELTLYIAWFIKDLSIKLVL